MDISQEVIVKRFRPDLFFLTFFRHLIYCILFLGTPCTSRWLYHEEHIVQKKKHPRRSVTYAHLGKMRFKMFTTKRLSRLELEHSEIWNPKNENNVQIEESVVRRGKRFEKECDLRNKIMLGYIRYKFLETFSRSNHQINLQKQTDLREINF